MAVKSDSLIIGYDSIGRSGGYGIMDEEYDYCYECTSYGDDYYYDEEINDLVCACYDCPHNENNWEDGWWIDDI